MPLLYFIDSHPIRDLNTYILNFCLQNEMTFVTLFSLEEKDPTVNMFIKDLSRKSKNYHYLRSRILSAKMSVQDQKIMKFEQDFLIIVTSDLRNELPKYLGIISKRRIRKSLMVILNSSQYEVFDQIKKEVQNLSENAYFYVLHITKELMWPPLYYRVISIKGNNNPIIQLLMFNELGKIKDVNNLEGMHIKCLALSYPPHITIYDCDPKTGVNCTSKGYLPELLNIVGKRLNFTWSCDKEMNNNWGIIQVSGPANASGVWDGVIGGIFYGAYPMNVASWAVLHSRIGIWDYVFTGRRESWHIAFISQMPKVDRALFTRPFRDEVWLVLGIGNTIVVACLLINQVYLRGRTQNISLRFIRSVTYLSYFLIIIYYGGALKMFFTADVPNPFNSRSDVMRAHPEWKLKFRNGNFRLFMNKAEDGHDPIYKKYWERAEANLDEYQYGTIAEGVQEMHEKQIAIHALDTLLKQYYKNTPNAKIPTIIPSEGEFGWENMVVTENSPLGPILQRELSQLAENGIVDYVRMEWIGNEFPKPTGKTTPGALGQGQVTMIFIILCVAVGCSAGIMTVERIYVIFKSPKNGTNRSDM